MELLYIASYDEFVWDLYEIFKYRYIIMWCVYLKKNFLWLPFLFWIHCLWIIDKNTWCLFFIGWTWFLAHVKKPYTIYAFMSSYRTDVAKLVLYVFVCNSKYFCSFFSIVDILKESHFANGWYSVNVCNWRAHFFFRRGFIAIISMQYIYCATTYSAKQKCQITNRSKLIIKIDRYEDKILYWFKSPCNGYYKRDIGRTV
jgi:hypothetical protein